MVYTNIQWTPNICIAFIQRSKIKVKVKVKVKVQIYCLIYQVGRLISQLYILPPGHWTCPFVCHFNSTESILSCGYLGALNFFVHISVLQYTHLHLSQVKHVRLKCFAQYPNIDRGDTLYLSENPARSGVRKRMAGSDIDIETHSNHCAMSLSRDKAHRPTTVFSQKNVPTSWLI